MSGADSDEPPRGGLRVDGSRGAPLRECVREALAQYFAQLDGHETTNVAALVRGEVEPPMIEAAMAEAKGNQTKAAAILGFNRATLRKKLRHYNLR